MKREIPLHEVYWSTCNCSTATCIVTIIVCREMKRGIPVHDVYWSNSNCSNSTCIVTIIVYCGMKRGIPEHNVYWSNSNCSTATCIMTIIHSRSDNITHRVSVHSSQQHTKNVTHNSLRSSANALFDIHGLLITFICSM